MSNNNGGIWVKASERLPKKETTVFVKWKAHHSSCWFDGHSFHYGEGSYTKKNSGFDELVWLDEQPVIALSEAIKLRDAIEMLRGFLRNKGYSENDTLVIGLANKTIEEFNQPINSINSK